MYVLLEASPAELIRNLMEWLDEIVKDVASTDVFLFDHRRQCIEGHYFGLRVNECRDLISRISGLSEWAAECTQKPVELWLISTDNIRRV